jgi:DNA-binding NtrC family response regulator
MLAAVGLLDGADKRLFVRVVRKKVVSTMTASVSTERAVAAIERIAGVSPWAEQVRHSIELVSKRNSSVLIMGPSGTGKELIARAIHAGGNRSAGPFIPVDCAVTTGTLFASHMFGHVKGSFTGAAASTLGCFRAADGGTIFLDEIGEMELELQAKLLRVLQQRAVVPVGSHQEIPVDVRVVAATNRDLGREVADRRFREDLFYRLNVVAIQTMPLSDRPEDVPVLAARFLAELAVRHGMPLCTLSAESVDLLQQYSWPGNVRELENVLERAVLFATGDVIEPELLGGLIAQATLPLVTPAVSGPVAAGHSGQELQEAARLGVVSATGVAGVYRVKPNRSPASSVDSSAPESVSSWLTLADMERVHLERTLAEALNNKSLAARMLGIDRSVLRRKLQRHGLNG